MTRKTEGGAEENMHGKGGAVGDSTVACRLSGC